MDEIKQPQGGFLPPQRFYVPAVKRVRLILVACAILYTYGVHLRLGDINAAVFSFAFPALYIISGYLVLRQSENTEQRILRAIKRSAICFVILFAVDFAFSLFIDKTGTLALITQKGFWANFLVLNMCMLPVGSTIWFVQSLLYAYIAIYVIYKLKLLRFDIFFAILCLAVTLLVGELAHVVGFSFWGHAYLGGNFLTRALPYILIGSFIDRKKDFFSSLSVRKHRVIAAVGVVLAVAEYLVLGFTGNLVYTGHLFGMGLVAAAVCSFTFFVTKKGLRSQQLSALSRTELALPFFACSPLYALLVKLFLSEGGLIVNLGSYMGVITMAAGILLLYVYFYLKQVVKAIRYSRYKK